MALYLDNQTTFWNYSNVMSINNTMQDTAYNHSIPSKWGWWLMQTLTPLIVLVGIIGNCLSFVVMKSRNLRKKSYSHFLCALAVFDSCTLIGRQVNLVDYIYFYRRQDGLFSGFSDGACKAYNFLEHMCYLMSSWLVVVMAAERVVAVCLPFKKSKLRTQTGALAIIMSLFVILSYTQVFRFIMIGNMGQSCQALESFISLYINLHVYFYQFTLIFFLPFVLVLVFNGLVLYQIYRVRKAALNDTRSRIIARTHKTTCMLLAISFTYVITMLPLVTVSIIVQVALNSDSRPIEIQNLMLNMEPVLESMSVISYLNYGINFFIYIVSGQSFRFELRKIFKMEGSSITNGTRTREEVIRLQ